MSPESTRIGRNIENRINNLKNPPYKDDLPLTRNRAEDIVRVMERGINIEGDALEKQVDQLSSQKEVLSYLEFALALYQLEDPTLFEPFDLMSNKLDLAFYGGEHAALLEPSEPYRRFAKLYSILANSLSDANYSPVTLQANSQKAEPVDLGARIFVQLPEEVRLGLVNDVSRYNGVQESAKQEKDLNAPTRNWFLRNMRGFTGLAGKLQDPNRDYVEEGKRLKLVSAVPEGLRLPQYTTDGYSPGLVLDDGIVLDYLTSRHFDLMTTGVNLLMGDSFLKKPENLPHLRFLAKTLLESALQSNPSVESNERGQDRLKIVPPAFLYLNPNMVKCFLVDVKQNASQLGGSAVESSLMQGYAQNYLQLYISQGRTAYAGYIDAAPSTAGLEQGPAGVRQVQQAHQPQQRANGTNGGR